MTGTGSIYTHACIQIDGYTHKKTDRKLIPGKKKKKKSFFLSVSSQFSLSKPSPAQRELSPSPAQPFSTCWSASTHMVLLTPERFNTSSDWTFNSGLCYTLLPHVQGAHHCWGDSAPGQGTEFLSFPRGKWVYCCVCASRRVLPTTPVQPPPDLRSNEFWGQYCMLQIPGLIKYF